MNGTLLNYSKKFDVDKPVLLITEDHPEMRAFIAKTLKPFFEIRQAENGAVALQILNQMPIDILISDVMMPVMDGFELLAEVKKNEDLHQVSIIMLTARADQDDKLHALTLGIDDYLIKPFNASEFLARIKNILENRIKIIRELKGLNTRIPDTADYDWMELLKDYELSERELEVLRLIGQRNTNAEIADKLFISRNTVKFHVRNIYTKVGIQSRSDIEDIVDNQSLESLGLNSA